MYTSSWIGLTSIGLKRTSNKAREKARLSLKTKGILGWIVTTITDPVEHVSHFNQRMAVHSKNKALMCKIFPSSLGPMVMR